MKALLADAEAAQRRSKEEAAKIQHQTSEKRLVLEQELAKLNSDLDKDKSDFERKIKNERLKCDSHKASLEKLCEEHRASYKAVFDGPGQQISSLEEELHDCQRTSNGELSSHMQKSEQYRARAEELEAELARMHAKLEQTEHEVQDTTARLNLSRVTNQASVESLHHGRTSKQDEFQKVRFSIAQKKEQLHNISSAAEEDRRRIHREIEGEKNNKAKKLADIERKIQALRSEHSFSMVDKDTAVPELTMDTSGPSHDRSQLFCETDRLRSLCDGRHSLAMSSAFGPARHLQDISNQQTSPTSPLRRATESALASMEKRAADLRRGLQK
jgi:hypothetical protein